MRNKLFMFGVAAVVFAAGVASAGEHGGMQDHAKVERALRTALVISLAEDLQLSEEQTIGLVRGYLEHSARISALEAQQEELRGALMQGEGDAGGQLDALKQVDQQLAQARAEAASQVGAELSAAQQAKVYLLMSTMDEHVGAILGKGGSMKDAHAGMGAASDHAGAAEEAAAPAAEADPETAIKQVLQAWADGLKAADIEKMMQPYSENFEHYEYGDKAGVRDFLQNAMDMGYLEGIEVDMADTEIEVEGEEATAYPVDLNGNFGQATIEFTLTNEGGGWKVTGMDMSGV